MTSIDRSFTQMASSVAASITQSRSSSDAPAIASAQPASIRRTMMSAFEGLVKNTDRLGSADPGLASIEPFAPPQVPPEAVMARLTEALHAFNEITGAPNKVWKKQSTYMDQAQQMSDQQFIADLGKIHPSSDKQFATDFGKMQSLSDKQFAADLGEIHPSSDKQFTTDFGKMQSLPDKQFTAELGKMQSLPDKQFTAELGKIQPLPDKQVAADLGNAQSISGKELGSTSVAQGTPADGPALTMLNHCSELFGLLNQIVNTEKELKLGPSQNIR